MGITFLDLLDKLGKLFEILSNLNSVFGGITGLVDIIQQWLEDQRN